MPLLYKFIVVICGIALAKFFPEFQVFLAFFLILVFGIPHGATDHVLHNIIKEGKINKDPKIGFLLYYLGVIAAYGILWFLLPSLSLLLFLLISAFHFGETQLIQIEGNDWKKYLTWSAWGSMALLLIFLPHLDEVGTIISPWLVSESVMNGIVSNYEYILIINFLILLIPLFFMNWKDALIQMLELGFIFALSYFSSLLLSFAIFFAFWHSRDATMLQIEKIRNFSKAFNVKNWIKLALPYTIISLIGIGLIILFSNYFTESIPVLTLFFVLVALITLPHVFVMSTFYRSTT